MPIAACRWGGRLARAAALLAQQLATEDELVLADETRTRLAHKARTRGVQRQY